MRISRRHFIQATGLTLIQHSIPAIAAEGPLIESIEKVVLPKPEVKGGTWFHPRACMAGKKVFMTLQPIMGSDYFGPVHWTTSEDLGQTWSEFQPAPPLGWEPQGEGNEGVCDVTPEYHPKTGSVLALGQNVFYKTAGFKSDQPPRRPMYAVWKDGVWGPRQKLVWDDPRGSQIYTNNCGQRVMMPNGEVMMSFTFGVKDQPRAVCGVRCSFDGQRLLVQETGPELTNPKGRGLLEPSLTHFQSRFYLTIRAEDEHGYVAVSEDGLHYEPKQAWAWDDGEPLAMSTTQQHWLTHSDGLFLVYTRKDATNLKVMRWRAPLWVAQVDPKSLRLIRATERVVLPLIGDGVHQAELVPMMGNFGIANISAGESWVTDGSWCPKAGNSGELQLARIKWSKPNRLRA
ncbi:MAG: sialidase family protein [Chthoniobacter sp.]|uniref:sialidase family protein n=1 Tax=Chthoniobacter sp. TaxID=2510640 RepID=UPI0032A4EA9B